MNRFERALREALRHAGSDARAVSVSAEVDLDPEQVPVAAGSPWSFWDTRARPELGAEVALGVGSSVAIEASGPDRFGEARARLASAMASIQSAEGASPRAFGGLAFEPGRLGAFSAFGELRFVIPRWTFTRTGSAARATLVVAPRELSDPAGLLSELGRLARPRARRSPGVARLADDGKARFLHAARRAVAAVEAHELEKVVVVRRAVFEGRLEPRGILDALASEQHAVRFACSDGASTFLGATPELLAAWDGDVVRSEAVAGTLSRGPDPEMLRKSEKDCREHGYVVRAVRARLEQLGVSAAGPSEPRLRSLRHLHHLVTPIAGTWLERGHVLDLVSALHPTPAVLGVPAQKARAFLAQHEPFARGWFAAPIGWVDGAGHGTFVVALRSALLSGSRAHLFAGSGVVCGSVAEAELGETEQKLRTLLAALSVGAAATGVERAP